MRRSGRYAAVTLPRNSVGSKQIKKNGVASSDVRSNAVSSSKVKDGTLLGKDFKAGELAAGATGAPGATGATGAKGDTGAPGAKGDTGPAGTAVAFADYADDGSIQASTTPLNLSAANVTHTAGKAEMSVKAKEGGKGAGFLGGAGVAGLITLGALTATVIGLLDTGMKFWIAALIVTAIWGAIAAVLALTGKNKLQEAAPPVRRVSRGPAARPR